MTSHSKPFIAPFLAHYPEIDASAYIAETAAIVGAVRISSNSSIWHQVTLRGDTNFITIGEGTNVQDNSCVHISSRDYPTIIGNYVNIGHCALVHACHLHDHAFVGMGSIVMDGAIIETDGMLAAGSLLTARKHISAGELWAGRPARKMRDLSADEIADNRHIAQHYIELGRAHRLGAVGGPFVNMDTHTLPPRD
ncbi:MAG: gamma carbonic anhydrase family protein [Candidatus Puniceispirillaceae bacterium]